MSIISSEMLVRTVVITNVHLKILMLFFCGYSTGISSHGRVSLLTLRESGLSTL